MNYRSKCKKENTQALEVTFREYFHELRVVKGFLNRIQETRTKMKNINELEFIKI